MGVRRTVYFLQHIWESDHIDFDIHDWWVPTDVFGASILQTLVFSIRKIGSYIDVKVIPIVHNDNN